MGNKLRILVVDDEEAFRELLTIILLRRGHEVVQAISGEEALQCLKESAYDLILTDLKMSGMSGMALLTAINEMPAGLDPKPECIVITGYGSIENAVEAIKNGAFSYFVKSNNPEELLYSIDKIARLRNLSRENALLKDEVLHNDFMLQSYNEDFAEIIRAAEKVALTDANVLLLGESGVGKEVIARYIHDCSHRKNEIFMSVNCYAFSEGMIEAELYGHEKGSFTGSTGMRIGRFEAADQGTLFLDEIGDLPLSTQVKILRNIENKEIERIGSNKVVKTNFRLISATNKNIEAAVSERQFREDLYYRINTVVLEIPPLRARREDLPLLVNHFLNKARQDMKKHVSGFSPELMAVLKQYDYPGNIRELKNIIERLLVFSDKEVITLEDLKRNKVIGKFGAIGDFADVSDALDENILGLSSLKAVRTQAEKRHIERVLKQVDNDMVLAAQILQISTRQLYNKLSQFACL